MLFLTSRFTIYIDCLSCWWTVVWGDRDAAPLYIWGDNSIVSTVSHPRTRMAIIIIVEFREHPAPAVCAQTRSM